MSCGYDDVPSVVTTNTSFLHLADPQCSRSHFSACLCWRSASSDKMCECMPLYDRKVGKHTDPHFFFGRGAGRGGTFIVSDASFRNSLEVRNCLFLFLFPSVVLVQCLILGWLSDIILTKYIIHDNGLDFNLILRSSETIHSRWKESSNYPSRWVMVQGMQVSYLTYLGYEVHCDQKNTGMKFCRITKPVFLAKLRQEFWWENGRNLQQLSVR